MEVSARPITVLKQSFGTPSGNADESFTRNSISAYRILGPRLSVGVRLARFGQWRRRWTIFRYAPSTVFSG